ncbi:MAG: DnaJ domain-containing protein [Gemmatimonadaceae bacterium]|nr:DnaJ domain-containing protein [Gloeobacterales cyanobacterium ES-bin-141]
MERFTEETQAPYLTAGLAQYGADYYAVLGAPIGGSSDQIRQGYHRAAKLLHPDRYTGDEQGQRVATKLYTNLVTPAYDILGRGQRRQEYDMMVRLLGAKFVSSGLVVAPQAATRALLSCKTLTSLQEAYIGAVGQLACRQYEEISQGLARTGELSELNLAYLLSNAKLSDPAHQDSLSSGRIAQPSSVAPSVNWSERHFERGQDFLKRKQYREAVQSLREAIRLESGRADFYAHLGVALMRQGLPGMAKAEFQKALALDPAQALARQWLQMDTPKARAMAGATTGKTSTQSASQAKQNLFAKFWSSLNKPI